MILQQTTTMKNLMFHWSEYLDALSVVEGFRDVAWINISNRRAIGTRKNGTDIFKPVPNQFKQIKTYLEQNHPKYTLIRYRHHNAFIVKKNRVEDVKKFIKKYSKIPYSDKCQKEIGLLLGYPECCVKRYAEPRPYIPVMTCSKECETKWMKQYSELRRKHHIKGKL